MAYIEACELSYLFNKKN